MIGRDKRDKVRCDNELSIVSFSVGLRVDCRFRSEPHASYSVAAFEGVPHVFFKSAATLFNHPYERFKKCMLI